MRKLKEKLSAREEKDLSAKKDEDDGNEDNQTKTDAKKEVDGANDGPEKV